MTSPNNIIEFADHSFAERVVQSKLPVLLAFCADGCDTSQKLLALLANAAPRCEGFVKIAKVSLAESSGLAARFGVVSAPSLLLLRGGTVCYQFVGELSRRELDELLTGARADNPAIGRPINNASDSTNFNYVKFITGGLVASPYPLQAGNNNKERK
jgi:thioredoxin 1